MTASSRKAMLRTAAEVLHSAVRTFKTSATVLKNTEERVAAWAATAAQKGGGKEGPRSRQGRRRQGQAGSRGWQCQRDFLPAVPLTEEPVS